MVSLPEKPEVFWLVEVPNGPYNDGSTQFSTWQFQTWDEAREFILQTHANGRPAARWWAESRAHYFLQGTD
jgi:hypothetical protein